MIADSAPTAAVVRQTRPVAGETYSDTLRRLSVAQKSGRGAPAYSRYVNRKLGRAAAAFAFHRGLTPNGVTAVSAVMSFSGIALLALARPIVPVGVGVTVLLLLGYALDAADGQLARLRGGGSVSGEWLDHTIDAFKISSLHLAVLVSLYRFSELNEAWLLVPLGYTVVAAVSFFSQILNEQLAHNRGGGGSVKAFSQPSAIVSLLKVPTDYGVLCFVFVFLGWPELFMGAYTLMFLGSTGYLTLALFKWFADMRMIDQGVGL